MKRALTLLFGILSVAAVSAQDRAVSFKVFPPEYEVFVGGDRLPYTVRDGLRVYQLPPGPVRVNLTAPGTFPLSLGLDVKPGMPAVEAKLEPRTGPLLAVAEAATGKLPRNLAFSTDGKRLFVALQGEPGVDVFEVPSLKKLGRFAAGTAAFADVLAVGSQVWALGRDGQLQSFDPVTLAPQDPVALPGSGNAGFADLGSGRVAAVNWDYGSVTLVDGTKKATPVAGLGGSLRGFAFGQGTAYAALFDQGKVVVLDGSTWKVKASWNAGKAPRPVAVVGSTVFVGDMGSAQVLVVDGSTGKVLTTVGVASNPHQMATSAQGLVAVASRGRNNPDDYQLAGPEFGKVTVLDAKGNVVGSVWGRNQPTGLAFSADGKYLAFTDFLDDNVELYRVVF